MRALLGKTLIAATLLTSAAHAHNLTDIRGRTESDALKPNVRAAKALANKNKAVVWATYRINEIGPLKDDEKDEDTIERVIRYSLHRDMPVTGNDEGYDFVAITHEVDAATINLIVDSLPEISNNKSGLGKIKMANLIRQSLEKNLWVFVGRGTGENTTAEIVALFDSATNEYVYVVSSNFGLGSPTKHE